MTKLFLKKACNSSANTEIQTVKEFIANSSEISDMRGFIFLLSQNLNDANATQVVQKTFDDKQKKFINEISNAHTFSDILNAVDNVDFSNEYNYCPHSDFYTVCEGVTSPLERFNYHKFDLRNKLITEMTKNDYKADSPKMS